jgi:signal transduction histidine kinase
MMQPKQVFLILVLIYSLSAFGLKGQSLPRLDSLEHVLGNQQGEERVQTLNQLVYEYGLLNLESAKKYADEAYNLSIRVDNDTLRVESMIYYGNALATAARFDDAFDILNKAEARAASMGYEKQLADAYNQIARTYYYKEDLPKAWEYFNKSAQIRFKLGDEQQIAASYNNFALIELRQGNFEEAKDYLEKAYTTYMAAGIKERAASLQNNLANLFMAKGEYEKALSYLEESKVTFQSIGKNYELASVEQNLAIVYSNLNRYEEALNAALLSLALRRNQGNPDRLVSSLNTLGFIYYQKEEFLPSLRILQEAESLLEKVVNPELCYEVTFNLSQTQKALGDLDQAYLSLSKALLLKDSVNVFKREQALSELKAKVEIEEFQRDIANLMATSESQQKSILWLSIILILIVIFLLSLSLVGFRLKKSKDRATRLNQELIESYRLIEQQNKQVSELSKEKDYFLRIVAHDMGNQLANIHGLLQIIRMENELENKAGGVSLQYFDRLQQITNNLILMVRKVLDVRNLEQAILTLDPAEFEVVELVGDVVYSYNETAAEKEIELSFHTEKPRIRMLSDKQFLAQSVDNLVSNAIKFSPRGKKVEVFLRENDNQLTIEVHDQGPGITSADKRRLFLKYQRLSASPTGNESSTGLGLSIVKRYVDLMGGKVSQENRAEEGCVFRIVVPLRVEMSTEKTT